MILIKLARSEGAILLATNSLYFCESINSWYCSFSSAIYFWVDCIFFFRRFAATKRRSAHRMEIVIPVKCYSEEDSNEAFVKSFPWITILNLNALVWLSKEKGMRWSGEVTAAKPFTLCRIKLDSCSQNRMWYEF